MVGSSAAGARAVEEDKMNLVFAAPVTLFTILFDLGCCPRGF
jgi:hypothetical protein